MLLRSKMQTSPFGWPFFFAFFPVGDGGLDVPLGMVAISPEIPCLFTFYRRVVREADPYNSHQKRAHICGSFIFYSFRIRSAVLWLIWSNCSSVSFSFLKRSTSVTGSQRG